MWEETSGLGMRLGVSLASYPGRVGEDKWSGYEARGFSCPKTYAALERDYSRIITLSLITKAENFVRPNHITLVHHCI